MKAYKYRVLYKQVTVAENLNFSNMLLFVKAFVAEHEYDMHRTGGQVAIEIMSFNGKEHQAEADMEFTDFDYLDSEPELKEMSYE